MHGYDQLQALTVAAQNLSAAKEEFRVAGWNLSHAPFPDVAQAQAVWETRRHELGVAKAVYRAAYKAYTNPFGIEKTYA